MNLLDEAWIPVRRVNGKTDWITPYQITDPDIIALDARRPDFNGALIQLIIGLVQTTTPMDSHADWLKWNNNPPPADMLKKWFEPVREAFVFDGDGPRFMQDFSLRTEEVKDEDFNNISALLIESPGEQTRKENKDHFIKRGSSSALCKFCVATALFTLQTNAPAGGNGNFTSIRGGGPLTSLICSDLNAPIWQLVWLNVMEKSKFFSAEVIKLKSEFIFPWLVEMTTIQPVGGKTAPVQVHPAHIFWGMPRRIRLDYESVKSGVCEICERHSEKLVTRYVMKPRGFDYKGNWNHPLSPYYGNTDGEMLPLHPQPGGIGYKHWLSLILGISNSRRNIRPASVISHALEKNRLRNKPYRLWVFGYDMDNMKARCWYESALPLYGLPERDSQGRQLIQREVARWIDAADHAAFLLRIAVKNACFNEATKIRRDMNTTDSNFGTQTENHFYHQLRRLIEQIRDGESDPELRPMRESWRDELIKVARLLFDVELGGVKLIEKQNPKRVAEAWRNLNSSLYGYWKKNKRVDKLRDILSLPPLEARSIHDELEITSQI